MYCKECLRSSNDHESEYQELFRLKHQSISVKSTKQNLSFALDQIFQDLYWSAQNEKFIYICKDHKIFG